MAIQNVTELRSTESCHIHLAIDEVDRADALTNRIAGIADVLSSACVSDDAPPGVSILAACEVISEMAAELKAIVNGKGSN